LKILNDLTKIARFLEKDKNKMRESVTPLPLALNTYLDFEISVG
jgi:hypothetical protein